MGPESWFWTSGKQKTQKGRKVFKWTVGSTRKNSNATNGGSTLVSKAIPASFWLRQTLNGSGICVTAGKEGNIVGLIDQPCSDSHPFVCRLRV